MYDTCNDEIYGLPNMPLKLLCLWMLLLCCAVQNEGCDLLVMARRCSWQMWCMRSTQSFNTSFEYNVEILRWPGGVSGGSGSQTIGDYRQSMRWGCQQFIWWKFKPRAITQLMWDVSRRGKTECNMAIRGFRKVFALKGSFTAGSIDMWLGACKGAGWPWWCCFEGVIGGSGWPVGIADLLVSFSLYWTVMYKLHVDPAGSLMHHCQNIHQELLSMPLLVLFLL